MECPICYDSFTKVTRRPVQCPKCPFKGCMACVQMSLLSNPNDPCCPECKKLWDRDFIADNFSKAFLNGKMKEHYQQVLMDRERSMFPDTQIHIEHEKVKRERRKDIAEIQKIVHQKTRELAELHEQIRAIELEIHISSPAKLPAERKQFVRACPANDCRGFLSSQWKCGVCDVWVCPECHEVKGKDKDAPHTCNPDVLASAKMLAKDTKPCPKCAAMIFRVSGCPQMWCSQCHTAFDWNTGRIETGNIHNPHYFEWRARNQGGAGGAAGGAGQCRDRPNDNTLRTMLIAGGVSRHLVQNIGTLFYRFLVHIRHHELPRYTYGQDRQDNLDLRMKFMMNEINEEEMMRQLQQRDKRRKKELAIYQILETFMNVGNDILFWIIDNAGNKKTFAADLEKQIDELVNYINTELQVVSNRFSCVVPQLDKEKWEFTKYK